MLRTLLAPEPELDRRKTPRARELCGKVRQQVMSLYGRTVWYRRIGVWLAALVIGGIIHVFQAMGFHLSGPG